MGEMRTKLGRTLAVASLATAATLGGCASRELGRDTLNYPDIDDRPTTLALRGIALDTNEDRYAQPWYASRNDARLTVIAGYQTPLYQSQTTITYDRQSHHNGQVHDYYNSTTYRYSTQQTTR